jgi:hypothetical protein
MRPEEAAEYFTRVAPDEEDNFNGELYECDICGSLVPEHNLMRHAEWHENLTARTSHAAES